MTSTCQHPASSGASCGNFSITPPYRIWRPNQQQQKPYAVNFKRQWHIRISESYATNQNHFALERNVGFHVARVINAVAEERGSRTHQARCTPLTGFEDRAPHRGTMLLRGCFYLCRAASSRKKIKPLATRHVARALESHI